MARINKIDEVHVGLDEQGRIKVSFVNGKIVDSRVCEEFDASSMRRLAQGVSRDLVSAGYSPDLQVRNGTGYLSGHGYGSPIKIGELEPKDLLSFANALYSRLSRVRRDQTMNVATGLF